MPDITITVNTATNNRLKNIAKKNGFLKVDRITGSPKKMIRAYLTAEILADKQSEIVVPQADMSDFDAGTDE